MNEHLGPLDEFIEAHTKLVHKISRRFINAAHTQGLGYEDIVQEGFIGLIKAYNRFDHTKGFKISTFAVPYIWGSIRNTVIDSGAIDAPRAIREIARLIYRFGLEDKPAVEVADRLGCKVKQAENAIHYQSQQVLSAEYPINKGSDNELYLLDILPIDDDQTAVHVEGFLSKLTPKQASVTRMKMLDMTQREIAKVMGVSQMQISKYVAKIGKRYLKVM